MLIPRYVGIFSDEKCDTSMHCLVLKFVLQLVTGSERIAAFCLDT